MAKTETLEDFYNNKFNWMLQGLKQDLGHFKVFRIEDCVGPGKQPMQYNRRDFYKISLIRGISFITMLIKVLRYRALR